MLNKILMIVVSVTIFGILFFLFIKKALKKKLNEILLEDNKNKKENNKL